MSKKDPFALLKAMGYSDLPGLDALSGVNEATGKKLLAKAMKTLNERKLSTAENMRDSRNEVTSGWGSLGNILSADAGKRQVSALNKTMAANANTVAQAEAAETAFARQEALRAQQDSRAATNLQNRQHGEVIQGREDVANINQAGQDRRHAAGLAFDREKLALEQEQSKVENDPEFWKMREKAGKALSADESVMQETKAVVDWHGKNPETWLDEQAVEDLKQTFTRQAEVAGEFEKLWSHKVGTTRKLSRKDLETEARANGELAFRDGQAEIDDEIIRAAEEQGLYQNVSGMTGEHMDAWTRREMRRDSSLDLNIVSEMTDDKLSSLYASNRNEVINELGGKLFAQQGAESQSEYIVDAEAAKRAGRTPAQAELHNLMSRLATAEGLRIGGTTLNDKAVAKILSDLGIGSSITPALQAKALNNHIGAANQRLTQTASNYPPGVINQYIQSNEGTALTRGENGKLASRLSKVNVPGGHLKGAPYDPDANLRSATDHRENIQNIDPGAGTPMEMSQRNQGDVLYEANPLTAAGRGLVKAKQAVGDKADDYLPGRRSPREKARVDEAKRVEKEKVLQEMIDSRDQRRGNSQSSVLPKTMKVPQNEEQAHKLAQTMMLLQQQSQLHA